MAARRGYSENDMMRMQQDAVNRVRDMQSRARQAANDANQNLSASQKVEENQGWSTNPNMQRHPNPYQRQDHRRPPTPDPYAPPRPRIVPGPEPEPEPIPQTPPPEPEAPKKTTTIVEDILGAVGLDDDRLLIIGLLFILINAKADTTLIFALIYLLI